MEKDGRKDKPSIVIPIIFLVFSIILVTFTVYNIVQLSNLNKDINNLNNTLTNGQKNLNYEKENQDFILADLNHLNNIDDEIQKEKDKVFELAKKLEEKILNNETDYKIAYLTFDDGPYYLTYKVLDLLKENSVKATFFTIGQNKERCFDNHSHDCTPVYSKIVESGHTIANHTYSHAIFYGLYDSINSFMTQVKKQEDNINGRTGVTTNILRFPGGSNSAGYLKNGIIEKLRENGYGWVDWTAQDGDGGSLDSKETAWRNFTNSINENIEVVLFHDYSNITYSILNDAIKYLKDRNYILLPLFYDSVKINK